VAKLELRIPIANRLDAIAANERDAVNAVFSKRLDGPVEYPLGVSAVVGISRLPRPAPMIIACIS
jgi:hypothetical protein